MVVVEKKTIEQVVCGGGEKTVGKKWRWWRRGEIVE